MIFTTFTVEGDIDVILYFMQIAMARVKVKVESFDVNQYSWFENDLVLRTAWLTQLGFESMTF